MANEITLLCKKHHDEKTRGLLPDQMIVEANANPFNLRTGVSSPHILHYSGDTCEINIGGNRFITADQGSGTKIKAIVIDNTPLVGFTLDNGQLFLDAEIFDEANKRILHIVENELVYSIDPWDIQLVGNRLTIHAAHRKILVEIRFEVPNKVFIWKGRLMLNGVEVFIRPKSIVINNNLTCFEGNTFHCMYGLVIGNADNLQDGGIGCYFGDVPRYVKDRSEALKWERESFPDMD